MGHDDDYDRPPFKHKIQKYDLNSKIMLTAIISLSVVVLFIAILHFYAKCILRRQVRRREATLGRMTITPNNNPSIVRSLEPPKTGLDPLVVASLPTFVIKKNDERDSIMECSICLSTLEEKEVARTLPNCKHTFHAECIDKWFESHPNCPICRTEAEPRQVLMAEPREGLAPPTAPPLEEMDYPTVAESMEGASSSDTSGLLQSSSSNKIGGSVSRLSSFRRILSRERSSRRNLSQTSCLEDGETNNGTMSVDLERQ
ncbi:ubiquitin-protein ligase [Lithospermum erythrorhizon]|uniref:RING-type E3 ubiquitin transferase n=1 Tax=Lithospermum erythrorhizon TaxID=34254 RepID=A0AAV3NJ19_LITER